LRKYPTKKYKKQDKKIEDSREQGIEKGVEKRKLRSLKIFLTWEQT